MSKGLNFYLLALLIGVFSSCAKIRMPPIVRDHFSIFSNWQLTGSFSTTIIGSHTDSTYTLQNKSSNSITLQTVALTSGSEFLIMGSTCTPTLVVLPQATCTISLRFTPTISGTRNDSLQVTSDSGGSTPDIALLDINALAITPANFNIANAALTNTVVGATSSATFTLTNAGQATGTVSAVALNTGAQYSITGGTCVAAAAIATSGTCTIIVLFSPTSSGTKTDTIEVNYNDGVAAQLVTKGITALAITPASLSASLSPASFANTVVGASSSLTATITNNGQAAATFSAIGILSLSQFTVSGGTCASNTVLATTQTCTVILSFAPDSATSFSDAARISYSDGVATQNLDMALSGTGINPALIGFDATEYELGVSTPSVYSQDVVLVLTNSGDVDATSLSSTLPDYFEYTTGSFPGTTAGRPCSTTLAASDTCNIGIRFKKTFAQTPYQKLGGKILLTYNNGAGSANTSAFMRGEIQKLRISGYTDNAGRTRAEWDYGTVRTGGTGYFIVEVFNPGASPMPLTATWANPRESAFRFLNGDTINDNADTYFNRTPCTDVVAANSHCSLILLFTPTATSTVATSLDLDNGSGESTRTISLSGTGENPLPCACNPADSVTFGAATDGSSVANAYQICSPAHLKRMNDSPAIINDPSKYFRQCDDIDMTGAAWSGTIGLNDASGIITTFSGHYDGNNYVIHHYTQVGKRNTGYDDRGLFAQTGLGEIKRLGVQIFTGGDGTSSFSKIGGIAGNNKDSDIRYSWTSGIIDLRSALGPVSVIPAVNVGGLFGTSDGGTTNVLDHCFSTMQLTSGEFTGGLVGDYAQPVPISNSFYIGQITDTRSATGAFSPPASVAATGGISGWYQVDSATTTELWVAADLLVSDPTAVSFDSSQDSTGGIFGQTHNQAEFSNLNFQGKIDSFATSGGLIGFAEKYDVNLHHSSVTADITGRWGVGGIMGKTDALAPNQMSNLRVDATIGALGNTVQSQYFGGILGVTSVNNPTLSYTSFNGKINGSGRPDDKFFGGLVGLTDRAGAALTIDSSEVIVEIKDISSWDFAAFSQYIPGQTGIGSVNGSYASILRTENIQANNEYCSATLPGGAQNVLLTRENSVADDYFGYPKVTIQNAGNCVRQDHETTSTLVDFLAGSISNIFTKISIILPLPDFDFQ